MNNAEIIKGIEMTINGLNTIKTALANVTTQVSTPVVEKSVEEAPAMNKPVATGKIDVEQLKSMKYNEFKKFAASLGVKCTGNREVIMNRILALDGVEAPAEKTEEVSETKSAESSTGKRRVAKKTDEPVKDEFDEQAEKIASDTSIEDIIEALADVDVTASKRNAVAKLAEALRNGLIEVDDEDDDEDDEDEEVDDVEDDDTYDDDDDDVEDDEDEDEEDDDDEDDYDSDEDDEYDEDDEEDEEDEDDEEEDIEADSYFSEFDPDGFNNPDTMSDERKEAVVSKMDDILTAISEDNLSFDEIEDYIEHHATQDEIDLLGDEYDEDDEVKLYMELVKRTIDNDGEEHTESEDPYEVGEHDMCCGHKLKYVKKTKKYICEVCGAEYEAE